MAKQWSLEELSHFIDLYTHNAGMEAFMKLKLDELDDQIALNVDQMKLFLETKNIAYGIDHQLLEQICNHPKEYSGKTLIIAKGKKPIDGKDGYIEWSLAKNSENKPKELEDGRVDYYSMGQIANFKKGQLIAKRIRAIEGEPGKDVTGKILPARKGKEAYLKPGKNVVLDEDKDNIYAAIDGQVVITDQDKINVFPIYEVNGDIDFSIGNIDFLGTVVVRGNVPDGFKIHAGGDIKIYGNVEGAELIAKGDILIQQGILGHRKSFVQSDGNIKTSYILDGKVQAGENIEVSQSIMHSEVSAGKKVICKGVKGLIVGGRIQAGESVAAISIGNQMATQTQIEVGVNPLLRKELQSIQKEKEELLETLDKVNKALQLLERMEKEGMRLPPEKIMMRVQLLKQQLEINNKLMEFAAREQELGEVYKSLGNATIEVSKTIYPGVKLMIGKAVKYIKLESQHLKFILDEGEITFRPL